MFVKELEEALLDGRADLAVHSAKDLPAELPPGLAVLASPPREDARDVLVGVRGGFGDLPAGARVGTGSPRRAAQLRVVRPDLDVVGVRGNVDTRLRKLREGGMDALVLAAAGLRRLGITPEDSVPLDVEVSTPAPGQGLLALEGRDRDDRVRGAVAALADPVAGVCLTAERAALSALGGGCMAPVGAYCAPVAGGLRLIAFRADDETGAGAARTTVEGGMDDPAGLGERAARALAVGR